MHSIERIAGYSINTITKLLVETGRAYFEYQDLNLRNLTSKLVQCDEKFGILFMPNSATFLKN